MEQIKRVLITGGNAGIGRATCIQMAEKGYEVIMVCRNRERGEKAAVEIRKISASDRVHLLIGDLSSQKSVRELASEFAKSYDSLDVLINNAANFDLTIKTPVKTGEGQELLWATNFLGPVLLTHLLAEKMNPGARVINVSSKGLLAHPFMKINFEDPGFFNAKKYSPSKAYYHSKRALEIYTCLAAEKLKDRGILMTALRVTSVKIDPSRLPEQSPLVQKILEMKMKSAWEPEKMAKVYVALADSPEYEGITGVCFNEYGKKIKSSGYVLKKEIQEKLWETASHSLGL